MILKKWKQKLMIVLLVAAVMLQTTAMPILAETAPSEEGGREEEMIPGSPWYDTNILGNVPASAPSPEEDFNTHCNFSWLSAQTEVPAGYAKYGIREELEEENKRRILSVIEQKNHSSYEEQLVSRLYEAALDMDTRNEAGLKPILPYIEKIRNISTLDEMTEYLCSSEFHIEDPLMSFERMTDIRNASKHMMSLDLSLGLLTVYTENGDVSAASLYNGLMQKAGIPAEEAAIYNQAAEKLGTELNQAVSTDDAQYTKLHEQLEGTYHPFSKEELQKEFPSFPIAKIMESRGIGTDVTISLTSVNGFKKLDKLYRSENLEGLKGVLIQKIFDDMTESMDQESLESYDVLCQAVIGVQPSTDPRDRAFSLCSDYLSEPMGKIFVERFFTPEIKSDVKDMVEDIRRAFRKRIQNSDWLTQETRAMALDKLNSIRIRAVCADKWRDYSGLILADTGKKSILADYIIEIKKYQAAMERREIAMPVTNDYWAVNPIYKVGASYSPLDNSINIPAGILGGVFYKKDGSMEERYFSLGTIIGHELTHGFDPTGSHFDKTGAINDWWSPEDRAAYRERQDRVAAYYSSIMIKPDEYVDGERTIGESVADMGGVSLLLDVMKEKGNVDYQKAFRSYAALWPEVETSEFASALLAGDGHPPKYVRVNAVVQQFQEFYDAFQVKEGDGMYLAPENRVGIWK